ncbi:MAG TPA: glycosyltransferase family 4 protein [Anaerolineales bacterium]|nr:glycosyltransferase family 4 protein [Anaerolineales bacterium]
MRQIVFCGHRLFYEPLLATILHFCQKFQFKPILINSPEYDVPSVYDRSGKQLPTTIPSMEMDVLNLSKGNWKKELSNKLKNTAPEIVYIYTEAVHPIAHFLHKFYYFNRKPVLVQMALENRHTFPSRSQRLYEFIYWRRINIVAAGAKATIQDLKRIGMPKRVHQYSAYLPHLPADYFGNLEKLFTNTENVVQIGFAGRITDEKGWKMALAALTCLPENYHLAIAGAGEGVAELLLHIQNPVFANRVRFLGVLDKKELYQFYRSLDLLVAPALSRPYWTEQVGSVICEAMAHSLPVIVSDSGSMPEVVGQAGIITKEADVFQLVDAIKKIANQPELSRELGHSAKQRFDQLFSYKAYAERLYEQCTKA